MVADFWSWARVRWLRMRGEINEVQDAIADLSDKIDQLDPGNDDTAHKLETLTATVNELNTFIRGDLMATLAEVLSALENTGLSIIQAVSTETQEITAAIEAAAANSSDPEAFDSIIERVGQLGSTVGEAVAAMVPSLPTPTEPTPPAEPVPVPSPEPVPPLPPVDVPIEVTPLPDDLGTDGGSGLSFR